ncbi:MAG: hypothetical protein ACUVUC_05090 [Thermoguttaceae bacterium]
MVPQRSVLIVDRSEDTREVLKTVLERRGVRTYAAGRARRGLELARQYRPDLIVLDLEADRPAEEELWMQFWAEGGSQPARLVILGGRWGRLGGAVRGEFVSKPYHFGQLIRRIEQLLCLGSLGQARAA